MESTVCTALGPRAYQWSQGRLRKFCFCVFLASSLGELGRLNASIHCNKYGVTTMCKVLVCVVVCVVGQELKINKSRTPGSGGMVRGVCVCWRRGRKAAC